MARTLYVDPNDLLRPGVVAVRARMQPTGTLPLDLSDEERVLLREYGEGEATEATLRFDDGWSAHG